MNIHDCIQKWGFSRTGDEVGKQSSEGVNESYGVMSVLIGRGQSLIPVHIVNVRYPFTITLLRLSSPRRSELSKILNVQLMTSKEG